MLSTGPMSHLSHLTQESHISPTSPQMWITAVYKGVDNCTSRVRFAGSVRLSPSVDHLWTNRASGVRSFATHCAQSGGSCVRHGSGRRSSTGTHRPTGRCSTTRTHARARTSGCAAPLVHSFPSPDDYYYFLHPLCPHDDNTLPTVDRSRTLGFPGSIARTDVDQRTSVRGGHE